MDTALDAVTRDNGSDGQGRLGTDLESSPTPAVRGRERGQVAWSGGDRGDGLANALGVFSVALGVAQVVAPRAMARLVGLRPTRTSTTVMRLAGLREIGHGVGILGNPRPKEWVATRVGGDVLDLALLGVTLLRARHKDRALLATAAVAGVAALDLLAFEELSESRKLRRPEEAGMDGVPVRSSITVGAPPEEVYRLWRDLENLPRFMTHLQSVSDLGDGRSLWRARGPGGTSVHWEAELVEERQNERIAWRSVETSELYNEGVVDFRAAPRGGGTVVTVEMRYAPPGGKIGAAMLKLLRREPGQQVADDLRRLKQVLEVGHVVVSDATAVRRPRPARPLPDGES